MVCCRRASLSTILTTTHDSTRHGTAIRKLNHVQIEEAHYEFEKELRPETVKTELVPAQEKRESAREYIAC